MCRDLPSYMERPIDAPYWGFGEALEDWLDRAGQNRIGLAHTIGVDPSTVTRWIHGHKRPDGRSLALILALLSQRAEKIKGWHMTEALDGLSLLGVSWIDAHYLAEKYLQKGGLSNSSADGGRTSSPRESICSYHPDR
jgi:hypothetical protein